MNEKDIDALIRKACDDKCRYVMPSDDFFNSIAVRAVQERRLNRFTKIFRISVAAAACVAAGFGVALIMYQPDRLHRPSVVPENIFYSEEEVYVQKRIEASHEQHDELRDEFYKNLPNYSDITR